MAQSPPPPGAPSGQEGLAGCGSLLAAGVCPELRLSSFPARGFWHPLVTEINPVVSGLSSWPHAQLGVNLEHFAPGNCLRQKALPKYHARNWCTVGPCLPLSHSPSGNSYHVFSPCSGSAVDLRALRSFCQLSHRAKTGSWPLWPYFIDAEAEVQRQIAFLRSHESLAELGWTLPVFQSRVLLCSIIRCWLGPGPASLGETTGI